MNKIDKRKILFLGQLPPPWHGVSAINSWILDSRELNKYYSFYPINLTTAKTISNIGKQSLYKYFSFVNILFHALYKTTVIRPSLCYITLTPTGSAFFKDSIILLFLKLFRKPIIVHFHGKGITDWVNTKPKWVKNYYKHVLNKTQLIVLGENLIDDVKIVYEQNPIVLPNGIPTIKYKSHIPLDTSYFKIIFLSNLMIAKGILDFVESMKLLHKKNKNFKAYIIGASGDISIENIKQMLINYELQNRVEVLGPLYGEDKYRYLLNADVLVFPTHNEAFGLVILEAMQVGIPIISTNEGCIPEMIQNGENGYVIEKNNAQQIVDRLEMLIHNPALRMQIGEKNKVKFNSQYTVEIFEKKLLDIFNKVTN
jgi:glycosyltransferase involved in cell wall biosynthesis